MPGCSGGCCPRTAARKRRDEATDGRIALPQRTLAAMLGVQRPSLNKVLKELERDELIRIGYAAIDILDPAGLARRGQLPGLRRKDGDLSSRRQCRTVWRRGGACWACERRL